MSLLLNVSGVRIEPVPPLPGYYDPVAQVWSPYSDVKTVEEAIPLLMTGSKTQSGGQDDDTAS